MQRKQTYNESEILKKIADGDEVAFAVLYNTWQPILSSFIFRLTKSKELTAETVQDVFMKIWMSREALSTIDNFKSYLYVVSRNQAINVFRKSTRELIQIQKITQSIVTNENPENEDAEQIRLSLVDEVIENLPPRQREVYLLHRHEGLTYNEIAHKLNIGKESVKTHLQFAVKSITKNLQNRILANSLLIEVILKNL